MALVLDIGCIGPDAVGTFVKTDNGDEIVSVTLACHPCQSFTFHDHSCVRPTSNAVWGANKT